jgi:hypothetical protein
MTTLPPPQQIPIDLLSFVDFFHFGATPPIGIQTLHNFTSKFINPPPQQQLPAPKKRKVRNAKVNAKLKYSDLTNKPYATFNIYEQGLNQNVDEFLHNIIHQRDRTVYQSDLEIDNNDN